MSLRPDPARVSRALQSVILLAGTLFLGFLHASYWTIAVCAVALAVLRIADEAGRWRAMVAGAGWRQAAPGAILLLAAQAVHAALAWAIGFTLGVQHGDPPLAPSLALSDFHVLLSGFAFALMIGFLFRRLRPPA